MDGYTNSDHNCLDCEIYPSHPVEGSANDASDEPMYRECVKRSCYHTHYELYKRRDKLRSTPAQNHFGVGRLAALHSKSATMKWTRLWWIGHELPNLYNKVFYYQSFVLYNNIYCILLDYSLLLKSQ